MRWFVGLFALYVGLFVSFQTLRHWLRLGHSPIARLTNPKTSRIRKVVEDAIGLGLVAWIAFMALYVWRPGWWVHLPHLGGGRLVANALAVAAMLASAVLLTAGNLTMGDSWRMGISEDPQKLVRHGIYRHVRHPIYGGMIGYFSAAALLMPNVLTLPAMALAIFGILCEAALEEDYWSEHEPQSYAQMLRTTSRFFPGRSLFARPDPGSSGSSPAVDNAPSPPARAAD